MATYKVKDIPGFEGLIIVGNKVKIDDGGLVGVEQIINTSIIIGDRELRLNIPDGAIWISSFHLEQVDDSLAAHEFASDNPYGEFKYMGRFEKGDLTITHSVFENAVSITIYEQQPDAAAKTLYTASFFTAGKLALELVESMLHNNLDPDDLVFELKQLKENDYNG